MDPELTSRRSGSGTLGMVPEALTMPLSLLLLLLLLKIVSTTSDPVEYEASWKVSWTFSSPMLKPTICPVLPGMLAPLFPAHVLGISNFIFIIAPNATGIKLLNGRAVVRWSFDAASRQALPHWPTRQDDIETVILIYLNCSWALRNHEVGYPRWCGTWLIIPRCRARKAKG